MVVRHPLSEDRAAATHDSGDTLYDQRQILNQDSGMNGHVVDPLRGLLFHHLEIDLRGEIFNSFYAADRLVNRNRSDWYR